MAFLDFDGLGKFKTKLDSRFVTSVSMSGNTIKYTKGDGTQTDVGTISTSPSSPSSPSYTAGGGISISGTTISNSGVRGVSSGTTKGAISVNTNGTTSSVSVYGLGDAAYTNSSAYATAGHDHNSVYAAKNHNHDGVYATAGHNHDGTYLKLSGGTVTGTLILSRTQDLSGTKNDKPALIVGGTDTGAHLELDANEIHAKSNGTEVADLYLNNDGGSVHVGSGGLVGNASSATRLYASRSLTTNLASETSASFNGTADASIGVTGTLPVANGGTSATAAGGALLANLGVYSGTTEPPADKAQGSIYIKY